MTDKTKNIACCSDDVEKKTCSSTSEEIKADVHQNTGCSTDAEKTTCCGSNADQHEASQSACCSSQQKHDDHHEHEHEHTHNHDHADHGHSHKEDSCCNSKENLVDVAFDKNIPEGYQSVVLAIAEMDCPTEEGMIRKKFANMEEVHALQFNLIQRKLMVTYKGELNVIIGAIQSLGMNAILAEDAKNLKPENKTKRNVLFGLAALFAATAEIMSLALGHDDISLSTQILIATLAIVAIGLCGLQTYKKGWISIKNGKLNINALMSVAVTGAVLIGEFPEAAMVMVLFQLSEMLEARSLDRARNAIEGLMSLAPDEAMVLENGQFISQRVEEIPLGSTVRVIPGGRFSLDGVIIKGTSSIDESPITGESLPVDKSVDDNVYAGSINQEGEIEFKTTTTAENSTLMKIARTIEQAQGNKSPVERFVDQFSTIYTPIVFAFAVVVAIVSPFFGFTVLQGIYNALVILIIACPCALVISTPVAIVSGLTTAARQGILIKGGTYLEVARNLKGLAFDKTGTITEGKPKVVDAFILGENADIAQIAYSLAERSDHPISKAVATYYAEKFSSLIDINEFEAILGRGTSGFINDVQYYLGNPKLMVEQTIDMGSADDTLKSLEGRSNSILMLADDKTVQAVFVLEDGIKATSEKAIKVLHDMGLKLVMLSGDRQQTVDQVAKEIGLDIARGEQMPNDKMVFVDEFQRDVGPIGMIGDGINDAPALAKASIGFAMGSIGSDTAIETADVAIMDDDLMKLPNFLNISKRSMNIIRQNIALAIVVKLFFLALALFGMADMWMAVVADVGVSILVVLNALRLLKIKEIK